jgi:hypothetical protein
VNYALTRDCPFYSEATPQKHWCGRPCFCRGFIGDDEARAYSFKPGVARAPRHHLTAEEERRRQAMTEVPAPKRDLREVAKSVGASVGVHQPLKTRPKVVVSERTEVRTEVRTEAERLKAYRAKQGDSLRERDRLRKAAQRAAAKGEA